MTMDELVTDFRALLDTALGTASITADVDAYHRLEPPTKLRVMVLEGTEGEEGEWARDLDDVAGGTSYSRMHLQVIVEIPWDEKLATATALDDAVVVVKATVQANRDITADDSVDAAGGKYGSIVPLMVTYPGHANQWIKARQIECSWRV